MLIKNNPTDSAPTVTRTALLLSLFYAHQILPPRHIFLNIVQTPNAPQTHSPSQLPTMQTKIALLRRQPHASTTRKTNRLQRCSCTCTVHPFSSSLCLLFSLSPSLSLTLSPVLSLWSGRIFSHFDRFSACMQWAEVDGRSCTSALIADSGLQETVCGKQGTCGVNAKPTQRTAMKWHKTATCNKKKTKNNNCKCYGRVCEEMGSYFV